MVVAMPIQDIRHEAEESNELRIWQSVPIGVRQSVFMLWTIVKFNKALFLNFNKALFVHKRKVGNDLYQRSTS